MAIIRSPHDPATSFQVVRTTAQNKALSYEALGMLTYLLSQADDWVIGVDDLTREACGRDKAYRILKELTDAGHLMHVRTTAEQGKPPVWAGRTLYEQPFTEKPDAAAPDTDFAKSGISGNGAPVPEKPDMAKPPDTYVHASAGKELKSLKTQEQEQVLKDKSDDGDVTHERAKIFDQYTALTKHGIDSRIVAQQLLDDAEAYPAEWIDEAVSKAALNGVTNWNYVRTMLRTWHRDGKEQSRPASVKGKFQRPPPPNGKPLPASTNAGFPGSAKLNQQAKTGG